MLQYWRIRVLNSLLLTALVLGLLACVSSVWLSIKEGLYNIALFDCSVYGALFYMAFSSKPSYRTRAVALTAMSFLIGLVLLLVLGPFGAGPVWLFLFPVLTGVLLGYRASVIALCINGCALSAMGICIWLNLWGWSNGMVNPVAKWIVIFFNFMLLNALTTVSFNVLLKGLQSALQDEQTLRASLQAQQRQLAAANMKLMTEIAEKERVLRKLDERDKRVLLLAENSLDCIWQMDRNLKFTFVNPAIKTIFGFTPEEWIGTRLSEHCPPEEIPRVVSALSAGKNPDDPSQRIFLETVLYHKDGRLVPVEILGKPLLDERGRTLGLQGAARDISERKQAENQKADFEAQIARAQKLESIGTLAGGIAHDFNNILSAVLGYAELALADAEKGTQMEDNLSEILKAGMRARNLVRQILAFSRQTAHEIIPVKVSALVKEALKMLRATIPTTIAIKQNIESESMILGDPTQIHQVFMNLCTNAVHAMERNGGTLTVELTEARRDDPAVANSASLKPGEYVRLAVADTGSGMSPEILEQIFDPYFTTKKLGKGTGLGLSVAHGVVNSHRGEIVVESAPGKGSLFAVYFPLLTHEDAPLTAAAKTAIDNPERSLPD